MPSGYTATLYEGEQSFEDFVWGCARGMGALVLLRDSPDAPIPERFEPGTYYATRVADAQLRLDALNGMTADDAERAARTAFESETEYRRAADRRDAEIRARYEAMLRRVRAWEPPTPDHVGLR